MSSTHGQQFGQERANETGHYQHVGRLVLNRIRGHRLELPLLIAERAAVARPNSARKRRLIPWRR